MQVCAGDGGEACAAAGGGCEVVREGFYVVSAAAVVCGAVAMGWFARMSQHLQSLPKSAWRAQGVKRRRAAHKLH
jgi:hypothetical protein